MGLLHVDTVGHPHKPALMLLHGFLGAGDDWREVAEGLAPDFHCIMPDLPGHGRSVVGLDEGDYSFEGTARGLIAILDELGLKQAALAGYSMGGRIALYTALAHPGRFNSLVLEGANPGVEEMAERLARAGWESALAQEIEEEPFDAFVERWYGMPIFQTLRQCGSRFLALKEKRRLNDPAGLVRSLKAVGLSQQASLWSRLHELQMPVLLITGAEDHKFSALAGEVAARLPRGQRVDIPHAGHNAHFEQAQAFTRSLRDFFTGSRASEKQTDQP